MSEAVDTFLMQAQLNQGKESTVIPVSLFLWEGTFHKSGHNSLK